MTTATFREAHSLVTEIEQLKALHRQLKTGAEETALGGYASEAQWIALRKAWAEMFFPGQKLSAIYEFAAVQVAAKLRNKESEFAVLKDK